jgi:hypothetical protein
LPPTKSGEKIVSMIFNPNDFRDYFKLPHDIENWTGYGNCTNLHTKMREEYVKKVIEEGALRRGGRRTRRRKAGRKNKTYRKKNGGRKSKISKKK